MQTWSAPASRCALTRGGSRPRRPRRRSARQPVGAAVLEVALLEPEPEHVVPVVRSRQVEGAVLPRELPGPLLVVGEDHGLLGREQLPRAEPFARLRGVLRRHEVRVRAVGAVAGEVEHLRAERGQHHRHRLRRLRPHVDRRVHRVEVGAHGRERRAVFLPPHRDRCWWLIPRPMTNRPGKASPSVFLPALAAAASRA